MALTHEQVARLNEAFLPDEHEFRDLKGKVFTYITEFAIVARLSEIDPSWTWEIKNQYRQHDAVITVGTLTVCGVSRDGVGEAVVEYISEKLPNGEKQKTDRQANEAEKSSATDAFKRGGRLFGIGSYLLQTPDWVRSSKDVAKWLNGSNTPTPPRPQAPAQNHDPDRGNVPYEGGDFMDTPARVDASFVFVELKQDKKGEGYLVYQAEKDNTVKVNIFKRQRGMFERVGLASADTLPKNFVGTVERTEDGKFWNLINVASF